MKSDAVIGLEVFGEGFKFGIVVEGKIGRTFDGSVTAVAEFFHVLFDVDFGSGEGLFGIYGAEDAAIFIREPFGIFVDDGLADVVDAKVFENVVFIDGSGEIQGIDVERRLVEGETIEAGHFKRFDIGAIVDVRKSDVVTFIVGLNLVNPLHVDGKSVDEGEVLFGCAGGVELLVAYEVVDEAESLIADPIIDWGGGREGDAKDFGAELVTESGGIRNFDGVFRKVAVYKEGVGEGHMVVIGVFGEVETANGGFDLGFGIAGSARFEHGEGVFDRERAVKEIRGGILLLEKSEVEIGNLGREGISRRLVVIVIRMILAEGESKGSAGYSEDDKNDDSNNDE